jgi:cytochrome c biogenesis protein CcmG, thiol:disulfide interchange protein DsbE
LKRALRLALVLCACAPVFCATVRLSAQRSLLHRRAPPFVRRDLAGKAISLRAYRGKVVLLNFWATWCVPCRLELPRFAAWQRTYKAEGLQVIAISMDDDPAMVRTMARSFALDFPVVMGDAALGERYGGVLGLPVTFLVARDGTIAARLEGESHSSEMETMIKQLLERHRLAP